AGAVGMLQLRATQSALPIDFVCPKEPKPPTDPNKRRLGVALVAALLFLVLGGVFSNRLLAARRVKQQELAQEQRKLDEFLTQLQPDAMHIKALSDWDKAAMPWLDELYELTALFPFRYGLRVTQFNATPLAAAKNAKTDFVATLTVSGLVNRE